MAKRMKVIGLTDTTDLLEQVGAKAYAVSSYGLYEGAKVIADEIRASTPVDTGDLAASLTIDPFQSDINGVRTLIHYTGTDRKGTPNPLKAAAHESGTSRGQKATHFFSKAVNRAKDKAQTAIADAVTEQIELITKE